MKATMSRFVLVVSGLILASAQTVSAGPLPPQTGLVFDLNAANASHTGTTVNSWTDSVGSVAFTPSLTVTGGPGAGTFNFSAPTYNATGSPNGKPSIDFNGSNQALGTAGNGIGALLPTGSGDRTVIMVAAYQTTGSAMNIFGGFEYGGTTSGATYNGSSYDQQSTFSVAVIQSTAGTPASNLLTTDTWGGNVNGVTVNSGTWLAEMGAYTSSSHTVSTYGFVNGSDPNSAPQAGSSTTAYTLNTGTTGATLGVELRGNGGFAPLDISEILVYNTVLTPSQLLAVDSYVNQQWFQEATVPEPSSMVLLGIAVGGLALAGVRRRKAMASRDKK